MYIVYRHELWGASSIGWVIDSYDHIFFANDVLDVNCPHTELLLTSVENTLVIGVCAGSPALTSQMVVVVASIGMILQACILCEMHALLLVAFASNCNATCK